MAKYTAYDIAKQLTQIRNYRELHVSGFAELPTDVLSAFLWMTAEWRCFAEMEHLLAMGANPHEENEGRQVGFEPTRSYEHQILSLAPWTYNLLVFFLALALHEKVDC